MVEKWARRSNPGSFLLSASRLVCDSAGEDGRIGVFIVGGDYICPGRDKGRCREQQGEEMKGCTKVLRALRADLSVFDRAQD